MKSMFTLRCVHQNRETLLLGVMKNMNEICSRAFDDLCVKAEMYYKEQLFALEREKVIEAMSKIRLSVPQGISGAPSVQQQNPIRLSVPQGISIRQSSVQQGVPTSQSVQYQTPIWLSVQQERDPAPTTPSPVEEETDKTYTEEAENEEGVVPADDRTVFLTFSKGYLTSESEVRVYFTRRFGEVIEAILMQEVEENEQPLYARMVLKMECASRLEEIVSEGNKKKFTIDGKHVWARKYIRKKPTPSSSHV
ncbi:hypothetical protein N665_1074s0005 [Sinapis alba]|nr:hypothetical protein N665_1074s0005 [Sinapis alba]